MSGNDSEQKWLNQKIENWDRLSKNNKLKVLQFIENEAAKAEGRDSRKVKDARLKNAKGEFRDNEPDCIYIDTKFLKEKGNAYDVINTTFHEGRHAYQYDVTRGKIPEDKLSPYAKEQKAIWEANNEIYNESKGPRDYDYRFQPREDDANDFALKKTKEIFGFSLNADKKNYEQFRQEYRERTKIYRDYARSDYGDNYKEEISKEIQRKYTRNVSIREYAKELQQVQKDIDKLEKLKATPEKIAALKDKRDDLRDSLRFKHEKTPEEAIKELKEYNKRMKKRDGQTMSKKESEKKPEESKNKEEKESKPVKDMSDNALVKKAVELGDEVEKLEKGLNSGKLGVKKEKETKEIKEQKEKEYSAALDEITKRPNREQLIGAMEKRQSDQRQREVKEREKEKTPDFRSR